MAKPKTIITAHHIDIILKGIEDGYTIQQCCKELLKFSGTNVFYHNATKEQKDLVRIHKFIHSGIEADYARTQKK